MLSRLDHGPPYAGGVEVSALVNEPYSAPRKAPWGAILGIGLIVVYLTFFDGRGRREPAA